MAHPVMPSDLEPTRDAREERGRLWELYKIFAARPRAAGDDDGDHAQRAMNCALSFYARWDKDSNFRELREAALNLAGALRDRLRPDSLVYVRPALERLERILGRGQEDSK